jgi:hypothetical protein
MPNAEYRSIKAVTLISRRVSVKAFARFVFESLRLTTLGRLKVTTSKILEIR